MLNTAIRGVQIEDVSISGAHLVATNSATDGYVLSWNDSQKKFEWTSLGISVINETPSGTLDGNNTSFSLAYTPQSDTEQVFLNGLLQEPGVGNDYTISGSAITFIIAPETNDILLASYLRNDGFGGGLYLANIVEDTTPQLGGDLDLNQFYIQLDPTPDSDDAGSGMTVYATVDTNAFGVGAALYMASDGNYDTADASASGTMPCTALALETGTGTKKILLLGYIRNDGWNWTTGDLVYVSTAVGELTQSAPNGSGEQVQVIGYATSTDVIFFNPNLALVQVA